MYSLAIEYQSKAKLSIRLLDTPAVKMWMFCFLKNQRLGGMSSINVDWAPSTGSYPIEFKEQISRELNNAITALNSAVDGDKFPYWAQTEMSIIETQQIHRSFTTGITTGKAWKHGWDDKQLLQFKRMKWPEKRQAFIDLAPEQFKILDQDKFEKHCHLINDLVHKYEPSIYSQRSQDSIDKNQNAGYIYTKFNKEVVKPTQANLTERELQYSFPGDYSEYDVHIHSNIFGKSYRETYFEYDPPLEFDVTNVENITGEFFFSPPSINLDKINFKRCVDNSDWSKWLDDTELPFYLTRNPPLGKIVGFSGLDDNYEVRKGQLSGDIKFIDIIWE